jgi:AcrR family transcriptional regulator
MVEAGDGDADSAEGQDDVSAEVDAFSGGERIHRLLAREVGEEMADAFARVQGAQEPWERQRRPNEGLRERKKRWTRQQISDVATILFVVRGFDHVKVSEVAEIVGVSEKTIYNYFPTKESLVFDLADEGLARLAAALRERDSGESPTRSMLSALEEDMDGFDDLPDESHTFVLVFAEMIASTASLRAAWLDLQRRVVTVVTEVLAARAEVDPRDPEPMIAAHAIAGLQEVAYHSRIRRFEQGLRGAELREAVSSDMERAARLLDTGLWSFHLLTQGIRTRQQLRDAAAATENARAQVVDALKQARAAWREIRRGPHDEIKRAAKEAGDVRRQAKRGAARAGAQTDPAEALRATQPIDKRAAYEAFREMVRDRRAAQKPR